MWFSPIRTVDDLVSKKKTFKSICGWIEWNIDWVERSIATPWPTAEQVLKAKRASCNGFSVLTYEALKILGYEPHIIMLAWPAPKGKGGWDGDYHHAVTVFQDNGVLVCVDNGVLHYGREAEILDFMKRLRPTLRYCAEADKKGSHVQTLMSKI